MVRRDWFDCSADEVNERYIEYLGANNTFSDQYGPRVTVERFANIVHPLYEAKKVDLKNDGINNYNLKVSNHFNEILNSAYDEVADAIEDHLEDVATEEQGKTIINQSLDKTGGTFLTHLLTYNLAENLLGTDVAVAIHQPNELRQATTLSRKYGDEKLSIPLETDLVIFKPSDPSAPSIHFSMKSSMKERSHIVTMWALLRDIAQDPNSRSEYDIEIDDPKNMLQNVIYNFATADLAGDFDDDPRNLIKMDMSF